MSERHEKVAEKVSRLTSALAEHSTRLWTERVADLLRSEYEPLEREVERLREACRAILHYPDAWINDPDGTTARAVLDEIREQARNAILPEQHNEQAEAKKPRMMCTQCSQTWSGTDSFCRQCFRYTGRPISQPTEQSVAEPPKPASEGEVFRVRRNSSGYEAFNAIRWPDGMYSVRSFSTTWTEDQFNERFTRIEGSEG
jgi:hypothetical protein